MNELRYRRCKALIEEVMKCGNPNSVALAHVLDELLDTVGYDPDSKLDPVDREEK